ncbi:MAG TPA: phage/plasmid replication protein [Bryobacteraceae bacterium]|nr:phage/plasmid replication protein [Bryobacteraceae bacterium]
MPGEIFIDWVTLAQHHPKGGLPILCRGVHSWADAQGITRLERISAASVGGSFGTAVLVGCDGAQVLLSGNVGRLSRPDNLFNLDWPATLAASNRVLLGIGLPPFTPADPVPPQGDYARRAWGARLLRVDITCNFSAGSDPQAREVIRWIAGQSMKRVRRGQAGDSSVWWANTRRMFKAYRKGEELMAHGLPKDADAVRWCNELGIVRVEVELKRRRLQELDMTDPFLVTQGRVEEVFREETEILRRVDRSDEPDILNALPARSRAYAAAWLAGRDLAQLVSRSTLFRHAKVCREHGLDILTPRNVASFPVSVRVVELKAAPVPEWYSLKSQQEQGK